VEVALVLHELGDADVLDRDGIVGIGGNHRAPARVVVCGGQQRLEIRKHGVIDFDRVGFGMEIRDGGVAEIRERKCASGMVTTAPSGSTVTAATPPRASKVSPRA
jgi:hypothetical protein